MWLRYEAEMRIEHLVLLKQLIFSTYVKFLLSHTVEFQIFNIIHCIRPICPVQEWIVYQLSSYVNVCLHLGAIYHHYYIKYKKTFLRIF